LTTRCTVNGHAEPGTRCSAGSRATSPCLANGASRSSVRSNEDAGDRPLQQRAELSTCSPFLLRERILSPARSRLNGRADELADARGDRHRERAPERHARTPP
jgi:hypothetical protein